MSKYSIKRNKIKELLHNKEITLEEANELNFMIYDDYLVESYYGNEISENEYIKLFTEAEKKYTGNNKGFSQTKKNYEEYLSVIKAHFTTIQDLNKRIKLLIDAGKYKEAEKLIDYNIKSLKEFKTYINTLPNDLPTVVSSTIIQGVKSAFTGAVIGKTITKMANIINYGIKNAENFKDVNEFKANVKNDTYEKKIDKKKMQTAAIITGGLFIAGSLIKSLNKYKKKEDIGALRNTTKTIIDGEIANLYELAKKIAEVSKNDYALRQFEDRVKEHRGSAKAHMNEVLKSIF